VTSVVRYLKSERR